MGIDAKPSQVRTFEDLERARQRPARWARRALATVGTILVLTQTPIVGATGDFLRGIGEDTDKPPASEANMGGQSIVNVSQVRLENGNTDFWPNLRRNPQVHNYGKDGHNDNHISWPDVATINKVPLSVDPEAKTIITTESPGFVMGGNPDNESPGAPKGLWEVFDLTMKDGTKEEGYLSVSGNSQGFVETHLSGIMTPIDQQHGNSLKDKINQTTVVVVSEPTVKP
jgi:hypothetical protein